jgi:hypothetical protein
MRPTLISILAALLIGSAEKRDPGTLAVSVTNSRTSQR